ncbi:MAG: hypothetical protein B6D57_02015 [Candidatus Coatesbacteria bacterium 4484_99]|uniref:ABC transporter domain-containing protein n=1 Tax=Candidatus Coatesbacteria bacterium 4484_99 TaxID=1970774 RepID=A0A1W9S1V0_9BACT|nr:MAG: hypothetical protein B6D57_02015 [Candidatus Coatesbacteria bacterium 4484_99]RLC42177.1 MAG: hypothetical protein DRH49_04235 [Candidatus Coatesbacteria bacterium]
MPLIETYNLSKRYGDILALNNLCFKLEEGESLALLGRNGAGKTTTMKLILELIRPTSGTIKVIGRDHRDHNLRREIGYLPEEPALPMYAKAKNALLYYGMLLGLDRKTRNRRVDELLHRMGLYEDRNRMLNEYSRGMQQRVAFAQAIIGEPKILILDEPTAGLDPIWRKEIRSIIKEMTNSGCAALISSHILAEIELECDRAIIIDKGNTIKEGKIDELISVGRQYSVVVSEFKRGLITGIEKIGKVIEIDGNKLRIELKPGYSPQDIIEIVNKKKVDIVSISIFKVALEDIFSELVKEKK